MTERHSYSDYAMRRRATPALIPGAWPRDGVGSTGLFLNSQSPANMERERQLEYARPLAKEEIYPLITSRRQLKLLVDHPRPNFDTPTAQERHPHNIQLDQSGKSTLVLYEPHTNEEQGLPRHTTYHTGKHTESLQSTPNRYEIQELQLKGTTIRFLRPDASGVSRAYAPAMRPPGRQSQNFSVLASDTVPPTLNSPKPTVTEVSMTRNPIDSQKATISAPSSIIALKTEMDPTINVEMQQITKGIEEMHIAHRISELLHYKPDQNERALQVKDTKIAEAKAKVPPRDAFMGRLPLCHGLMQSSRDEVTGSMSGHISICHGDSVADQAQEDDRKKTLLQRLETVNLGLNMLKESQREPRIPKFGNTKPSGIAAAIGRRMAVVEADLNRANVLYNNEKVMLGESEEVARLLSEIEGIGALLQKMETPGEDTKTASHQQHSFGEEQAKTCSRRMASTETEHSTKNQSLRVRLEEKLQRADAKGCTKRNLHNQYRRQRSSLKSCSRTPLNQFQEPINSTTQLECWTDGSEKSPKVEQGGLVSVQGSGDRVIHTPRDYRLSVLTPTHVSVDDKNEGPDNTSPPIPRPADSFGPKQLHPESCMPPSPPLSPSLSSQCAPPRTQATQHSYHDTTNLTHNAKNAVTNSSTPTQTTMYDDEELVLGPLASTSSDSSHLLREPMKQRDPSREGLTMFGCSTIEDEEDDYVEIGIENSEWEIVDQNVIDSSAEAIGSGRYEWMMDLMKTTVL